MARGIIQIFYRVDYVDVILTKATRKYFPMVLSITLDNVLIFQSNPNMCSFNRMMIIF